VKLAIVRMAHGKANPMSVGRTLKKA